MPGFACPVCREPLYRSDRTLLCRHGHSYDLARQGYVNLLMSSRSSAKRHGDDKLMVTSRQRLLDSGLYAPLCDGIVRTALSLSGPITDIADIGCGECYYTAAIAEAFSAAGQSVSTAGIDISRDALIAGARRSSDLSLAVASVSSLPLSDGSCDLLLNIFAPTAADEFFRVLRPGGYLIRAVPGARHLWELKAVVYEHPYENDPIDPALNGFTLMETVPIHYRGELHSNEAVEDLFKMTPYYYKTGAADQAKLHAVSELSVNLEFDLLLYRRDA